MLIVKLALNIGFSRFVAAFLEGTMLPRMSTVARKV